MGLLVKHVCFLVLLAWVGEATVRMELFNVIDFGAEPNGVKDSSKALRRLGVGHHTESCVLSAFMRAWKKACEWDGKGRVLIPNGTFLVGPILFQGPCKYPIVVQVKGLVKAPTDLNKFPSYSWVVFRNVDSLMVTGGGTFDGQGASAWPLNKCPKSKHCKLLPTSLRFSFITNSTIRHISLVDSKFFHINILGSKNLKLQALRISAPNESPNTDGIHIASSTNVKISRSVIGTGDDCVSIGPGSKNITIFNIFCGPGHGISVGSLGRYQKEEDVVGLIVKNCTFTNTENGVRIKTWPGSPTSQASNFSFENIIMNNVYNPIIIDQKYCPYPSCPEKPPSRVKISNVSFRDIRGTSASQVAVILSCSKAVPCQKVELRDIKLEYNGNGTDTKSSCCNVEGVSYGSQIPPSCL